MRLEVESPANFAGDVLSDITVKRRGEVLEVLATERAGGESTSIKAQVI